MSTYKKPSPCFLVFRIIQAGPKNSIPSHCNTLIVKLTTLTTIFFIRFKHGSNQIFNYIRSGGCCYRSCYCSSLASAQWSGKIAVSTSICSMIIFDPTDIRHGITGPRKRLHPRLQLNQLFPRRISLLKSHRLQNDEKLNQHPSVAAVVQVRIQTRSVCKNQKSFFTYQYLMKAPPPPADHADIDEPIPPKPKQQPMSSQLDPKGMNKRRFDLRPYDSDSDSSTGSFSDSDTESEPTVTGSKRKRN